MSLPDGSLTLQPAPPTPAGNMSAFYYDRAYSRWVPVGRAAVSPDGSHYAYVSYPAHPQGIVSIVDVATGDVRTYPANPAQPQLFYVILAYAKEGIYLGLAFTEGPISGLWLMDPNTGAIRQLADLHDVRAIAGSAVWLGTFNPADPNPLPVGLVPPTNTIDRFDTVTGARTTWLYLPGKAAGVIAVDRAGHPIVQVGDTSNDFELLLLTAPGTAEQIFQGQYSKLQGFSAPVFFPSTIADDHGVWFGSSTGIFLYSPTVGLRKVSDQTGYPGNGCA